MKYILIYCCIIILLLSCNSKKNIDVALPDYQKKLVVECYLEPGKPYQLLLSESVSFFSAPEVPKVDNAFITITHQGKVDTLKYVQIRYDKARNMYYNYMSDSSITVPADTENTFTLFVQDNPSGRILTANTHIPKMVPIDTVELVFNDEPKASSILRFTDNPNTTDYYRYIIMIDSITGNKRVDFLLTDELFKTSKAGIGTNYWFQQGTPLYIFFYHLTKEHYEFYKSAKDAQDANGNPFSQPASIKTNIVGGLGIFTGITADRRNLITP